VEAQEQEPGSLLNTLKAILALRRAERELQSQPNLEILHAGKGQLPFVYKRGALVIALNPGGQSAGASVPGIQSATQIFAIGTAALEQGRCEMAAGSFAVWRSELA
jgi:maltose alpha-D-glucosyltransferase/alpha-amylase